MAEAERTAAERLRACLVGAAADGTALQVAAAAEDASKRTMEIEAIEDRILRELRGAGGGSRVALTV